MPPMLSSVDPAIASVIAAKDSAVRTQVVFAIAEKSLSAQKQQGEAMVQLLESIAQMGKAIDRGTRLDTLA